MLLVACLLNAQAPPWFPKKMINRLKYYVLQLGDPTLDSMARRDGGIHLRELRLGIRVEVEAQQQQVDELPLITQDHVLEHVRLEVGLEGVLEVRPTDQGGRGGERIGEVRLVVAVQVPHVALVDAGEEGDVPGDPGEVHRAEMGQ